MIVTFFSYKGGVGRSMALANVARWLQLRGLNVRIVDWDLEAPGIDTFFFGAERLEAVRSQLGLVDLLKAYVERAPSLHLPPNRKDALLELKKRLPAIDFAYVAPPAPEKPDPDAPEPGALQILGAGRREADRFLPYAKAVHTFDWRTLYRRYNGLAYFDWLRGELSKGCDVVLIDSRTGVTEMGGVCTRQMADLVVMLVAPNGQNLEGTRAMARTFKLDEALRNDRGDRRLGTLLVPSRVELSSEYKDLFREQFTELALEYSTIEDARTKPWDLRIPYVAKYAYREQLATGARDGDSDLQHAYRMLAAHIAWFADTATHQELMNRLRPDLDDVFGLEATRIRFKAADTLRSALKAVDSNEQLPLARGLLLRLTIVNAKKSAKIVPRQIPLASIDAPGREVVKPLVTEGALIISGGSGSELIGLANPDFLETETMRRWIQEDCDFLVWRDGIENYLGTWVSGDRGSQLLLPAPLVLEALQWLQRLQPHQVLFESEREFIEFSRLEVERQRERQQENESSVIAATRAIERQKEEEARRRAAEDDSERLQRKLNDQRRLVWGLGATVFVVLVAAAWGWNAARADRQASAGATPASAPMPPSASSKPESAPPNTGAVAPEPRAPASAESR